jgi:hypothetical protein
LSDIIITSSSSSSNVMDPGDGAGSGGHEAGDRSSNMQWGCVNGWVNDDIAQYFLFMTIALPTITLIGGLMSSRTTPAEREIADTTEGVLAMLPTHLQCTS